MADVDVHDLPKRTTIPDGDDFAETDTGAPASQKIRWKHVLPVRILSMRQIDAQSLSATFETITWDEIVQWLGGSFVTESGGEFTFHETGRVILSAVLSATEDSSSWLKARFEQDTGGGYVTILPWAQQYIDQESGEDRDASLSLIRSIDVAVGDTVQLTGDLGAGSTFTVPEGTYIEIRFWAAYDPTT